MFTCLVVGLCLFRVAVDCAAVPKNQINSTESASLTNNSLNAKTLNDGSEIRPAKITNIENVSLSSQFGNENYHSKGALVARQINGSRSELSENKHQRLTSHGTASNGQFKFSVDELLTKTFPKKISNDTGLNPCKADYFMDDIAITFADVRRHFKPRDSEDEQEKHKFLSESARKILEKKKLWKTPTNSSTSKHKIRKRAAATTIKTRLWEDGIVPYEIDESWNNYRKALARQAMRHWENYTCLKFVERDELHDPDYVFFTEKPCGCCSYVGKRGIGAQALSIGENCAKFGIVVHEIGHAIGYYHEHTRPDRDNYVHVFEENILKGQQNNFNKLSTEQVTSLGLTYDYDSIMHYARNTYSINTFLDTIQPIGIPQGKKMPEIGQRVRLSSGDIQLSHILYNCPKCGQTFQTKTGKFSAPDKQQFSSDEPINCEWRITASPGEKVILNITDMDIFKSTNCTVDYVEVRDGYSKKSKLLGRLCGRGDVNLIRSDTNRVLVTYVSQHSNGDHKGFTGSFEIVCGGVIHVAYESYLASPNYPDNYHPNKDCTWKITVAKTYQVAVKFLAFDLEHHVECRYDHLSIWNDAGSQNSSLVKTLCGSLIPDPVIYNSNEITLRFVSDKSNQRGGFSAKVIAEFNECDRTNHGCEQLCINTLGSFVCACQEGFELHWDKKSCVDACGGKFSSFNGTVTSPSFPELYPRNKHCSWEIQAPPQHVIFLNFTHFDLEGNNYEEQICDYDQVNVSSRLSNGKFREHGSFCGTRKPKIIASESNVLQINFGSDDSIQQTGFAAVYFMDVDECAMRNGGCEHDCTNTLGSYFCSCRTGFTLHEDRRKCIEGDCVHKIFAPPYGTISSPNYPKVYPDSKDCVWHIGTLPGHNIRVAFLNFNLEEQAECYFDYVQIFDGDSSKSTEIGKYCGTKLPPIILTSNNQLYMTFRSDNNVQKKGFWATYSTQCGGILQAAQEKRQIYSHPIYGKESYAHMVSCNWVVIGNDKYNVKVTFKEFEIEDEEECSYDYLEIFDGLSGDDASVGKFCGNQTGQEVTSTQEGLVLKFRTDDRMAGAGFLLEYELVEVEDYDTPLE